MILRFAVLSVLLLPLVSQAEDSVLQATYHQTPVIEDEIHAKSERVYHIVRTRGANAASMAMLVQLSRDLPEGVSVKLFSRLAREWHEAGEIDLASECRRTLMRKYPDSPESKTAFLKLIQTYSSGEVAHAHRLTAAMKSSAHEQPANRQMLTYAALFSTQQLKANKATHQSPALDWHRGTIQRLLGNEKAAIGLQTALKRRPPGDVYRQRVDMEEWLVGDRQSPVPLTTLACGFAAEKPYLDGVLNEAIWENPANKSPATNNPAAKPQAVGGRFAYDSEYLYLAIAVEREEEVAYEADERPRKRDAELSKFDRVRLLLDIDRDYASSYELTIDHRGWTADACWGDATWNPEWFVAADSSDTHWQIEAAVSWDSLVETPPTAGDAWAVRFERLLPEQPVTAKPQVAGFSVLLFE